MAITWRSTGLQMKENDRKGLKKQKVMEQREREKTLETSAKENKRQR